MDKAHKAKIDAAIHICEKRFQQFFTVLDSRYNEADAVYIKNFLLQNTVFAGGVFRSVFTDTTINNIDVFFTSKEAVVEFLHLFLADKTVPGKGPIFGTTNITKGGEFLWSGNSKKEPMLAFCTERAEEPNELIRDFDFSFNRHYFDMYQYQMCFDADTFEKKGSYLGTQDNNKQAFACYVRMLRFMQQGFQIDTYTQIALGRALAGIKPSEYTEDAEEEGQKGLLKNTVHLTDHFYTEREYFDLQPKKTMIMTSTPVYTAPNPVAGEVRYNTATREATLQQAEDTMAAVRERFANQYTQQVEPVNQGTYTQRGERVPTDRLGVAHAGHITMHNQNAAHQVLNEAIAARVFNEGMDLTEGTLGAAVAMTRTNPEPVAFAELYQQMAVDNIRGQYQYRADPPITGDMLEAYGRNPAITAQPQFDEYARQEMVAEENEDDIEF